jgi:hypothetical protein
MAGSGTRATATDFNNIQSTVSTILGVGSGTNGYGQPLLSAQVAPGSVISSTQWNNLRTDLSNARVHQTNVAVADGLASIAANRGSPWQTLQLLTSSTAISDQIRDQYNQFATGISSNALVAAAAQLSSPTSISTTTRATPWGAPGALSITHTVTVTFAGYTSGSLTVSAADHLRCFYNAGGYLQVVTSLTGGTSASANTKDYDWKNMLSGYVSYNLYINSAALGSGGALNSPGSVNTGLGYTSLTTGGAATTVLTQASSYSKYAENRFTIAVAKPTSNTLTFTMTFTDNDTGDQVGVGPGVDESITGTITSTVNCVRPTGSNVSIPAPTASSTVL